MFLDICSFCTNSTLFSAYFLAFEQVEMPCEYVMKLKPTEYGFCYTFDGTDKNLTFNARTTGSKAGVQFMLWANQSNYYIADEDSAGFKVRIYVYKQEGTSRQRSGKGTIRKRFPLQKPR